MSRKDYKEIARIIREQEGMTQDLRFQLAAALASVFACGNDRFQRHTFIAACMRPEDANHEEEKE